MWLRGRRGEVTPRVRGGSGGHLWSSAALLLGCSAPRPRVLGYSAPRHEGLERSWDEVLLHGKVLHKGSGGADLSREVARWRGEGLLLRRNGGAASL